MQKEDMRLILWFNHSSHFLYKFLARFHL